MAVHDLSAVDLVVSEWQLIHTIPHDGETYDVKDSGSGEMATAFWDESDGRLHVSAVLSPTHWRYQEG